MKTIESAIGSALEFLAHVQQPDGEIAAYRYDQPDLSDRGEVDPSNFATSFALYALEFVDHPWAVEVERKARALLMKEGLQPGVWRYSARRLPIPIEPDLDDTCCIAFAFRNWEEGRAFTRDNIPVILRNRDRRSGLFKTWIREPESPNDIDYVVNANVLLYLGERPETLAALDVIVGAIDNDEEGELNWYYSDMLFFYYSVARAYAHGVTGFAKCRDAVMRKIVARHSEAQAQSLTAMSAACSFCTMAQYGIMDEKMAAMDLDCILRSQASNGSFPRFPLYTGWIPPYKCRHYWGSEALTTSFCIEALGHYARTGGIQHSE